MANKKPDTKRIVLIIAAVFALIVVIFTIYWIIEAPKTATIDVVVAPVSANIKVGNIQFHNGQHRIEPGTYNVEISKDGFGSYSGTITLEKGQTEKLYVCLQKNENNTEYYSNNQEDADACWQVEEYEFEKLEGEKYKDPIFQVAPFHSYSRGFYIDPYLEEDDSVHIKITLVTCLAERAEGLKQNALEWLSNKKIDVNKYEIEYSSCAYDS